MILETSDAILVAAGLATAGWLYTNNRARALAKKQHTINTLLQTSFNKEFLEALSTAAPHLKLGHLPAFTEENEDLRIKFRTVLNHYEFISAAVRDGDFDEKLIRNTERATVLALYKSSEEYIYNLRNARDRQSIYEHIEWLYMRWTTHSPAGIRFCVEWVRGKPFRKHRKK